MPAVFQRNEGRRNIQVSNADGDIVITQWICFLGNSEVVARAGEATNEPEYVVSLYLESDYSQRPSSPMPCWFMELLNANGHAYHTLAEAARSLDDPAAFAEVERYRRHYDKKLELEAECRALAADIELKREHIEASRFRMEAYQLHNKLANLENRRDIQDRNGFRPVRRQNSRRFRNPGPGGPA